MSREKRKNERALVPFMALVISWICTLTTISAPTLAENQGEESGENVGSAEAGNEKKEAAAVSESQSGAPEDKSESAEQSRGIPPYLAPGRDRIQNEPVSLCHRDNPPDWCFGPSQ